MPEPTFSFEDSALEADMDRLVEEVSRVKEAPEMQSAGDREILKHAIRSFGGEREKRPSPTVSDDGVSSNSPLPDYAKDAPADSKLEMEYLIDVAIHRGLARANKEARGASDFVTDAFHDALAGKLYPELQKRGIVK